MTIDFTLLSRTLYLELPQGLFGWLWLLALLGLVVVIAMRWSGYQKRWPKYGWLWLAALLLLVPITTLFLAIEFPTGQALPLPNTPAEPAGPALVILAALPWMMASGLLGLYPGLALAFLTGILLAAWDTHSPFTPLELGLVALVFGALANQRYRGTIYRLLRQPLAAVLLLTALYPILYIIDILFLSGGSLANRLDVALTHVLYAFLAVGGQLFIAGIFAQVISVLQPAYWGTVGPLRPSPDEQRLQTRFFYVIGSLAFVLLVALSVITWVVAGNSARLVLRQELASTASSTADTVPFFLEAGQNYVSQLTQDPRLLTAPHSEIPEILGQQLRTVPFFSQLYLLDEQGSPVTGYPKQNYNISNPLPEELVGIQMALKGVPVQFYTVPPATGETTAQVSFIGAIEDSNNQTRGVLIGRADLASNLFTQSILSQIHSMAGNDGEGMLLDGKGRILFDTRNAGIMDIYSGTRAEQGIYYDGTGADGTRMLVYYQPVTGHNWGVVLSVPARRAQQISLNIAAPLLAMLLVVFALAVFALLLGLRRVTVSLQNLSLEANRISSGQLDHPLEVTGVDEIGQLRKAFEQMRVSLRGRLEELNRLLKVSQGVASSLEFGEAVQPVLEAALTSGACSARVVLAPSSASDLEVDHSTTPSSFGSGPSKDQYTYLDDQIIELNRQQEKLALTNVPRVRSLSFPAGAPKPESLLAVALRHENQYYGTLWLAYNQPRQFTEDELRFITTLGGQAALAAANNRLFQSAELGRQRLAAILSSTPDPVLVTDQQSRLLLANPAAWQALGLGADFGTGRPVDMVLQQKDLVRLLQAASDDKRSAEIIMSDGRVYLATASVMLADGRRVGRVCVLRDITHFKELDALKSEFVATVSHDLRSPLTLMRGYATMLDMVGQLNEQQSTYVRKIIVAVESMSQLVGNLLDLGRIEAGVDLKLEMVPVYDIVERVVDSFQLQAQQKSIKLNLSISDRSVPLLEADGALLQQALHNLVENSIKYTETNGSVDVKVQTRRDGILFEVKDSGIGIAPVDLPRLFEKFYRGAQREAKKQSGTGLGLAIVKSIAERHGGRVWVESQLGKGSTFYLLVPLRAHPVSSH